MKATRNIHFSKEAINPMRVWNFLERNQDSNPLHQVGYNILPGMFYLNLVTPRITQPIQKIQINFSGNRPYPLPLVMSTTESDKRLEFSFINPEGDPKEDWEKVCNGIINYGPGDIISNPTKLAHAYHLPGAIQRDEGLQAFLTKDRVPLYLSQELVFPATYVSTPPSKPEFGTPERAEERLGRKNLQFSVKYSNENGAIIEGTTVARVIQKTVLKKMFKKRKTQP